MSNFSHKGGAHENAAKKKETKEESFAHRMETLSGETDGRKKPSKKQKTRTLTVVLIVIAGVLAAKIFRFGTLMYGNPIKFTAALKKIREKYSYFDLSKEIDSLELFLKTL